MKKTGQTYQQRMAEVNSRQNIAALTLELELEVRADQKAVLSKAFTDFTANEAKYNTAVSDVRLALVVGFLELANLQKLLFWDSQYTGVNTKLQWLVAASVITIAGAGFDVAATVAKNVHGSDSLRHQRLKLLGGSASAVAGAIGVWFDSQDARKEFERGRYTIGWLYVGKTILGTASAATTLSLTFTYSATLIAKITGKTALQNIAIAVGEKTILAIGARIMLMSVGMWITLLTVGVQLFIIWLDDDELTKWCQRCAFSKWQGDVASRYLNIDQQKAAFQSALLEVSL